MTKKITIALCTAAAITSFTTTSTEVELKQAKTLLQGGSVQTSGDCKQFSVLQLDGELTYRLIDNQATVTFDSIKDTNWRMTYDRTGEVKELTFSTSDGQFITDQNNVQYNIIKIHEVQRGQFSFCTQLHPGRNGTHCQWEYKVTEALPNILMGIDLYNGETWTAYRLIN